MHSDGSLTPVKDGELPDTATSNRKLSGIRTISAFHFFAYFYPEQAIVYDDATTAEMNATPAVRNQMIAASRATNMGKNSGKSYWSRIVALAAFENWVLA